ncbi:MAG TPA: glycosyltransferase family 2 protein [Acidobacteria bacterium]|jgi:glycosyltransferase involved in cell wall biosynthesis|nr:glycosyltransferase family 2 protein [Acidobacteriota bacterium]HIN69751.1 glycosyltransferase family 2 protein [Acidobacteriota bacterium]
MTFPLVSICVPTIGRLEYLSATLQSLREQTYENYEVIVLDNASGPEAQSLLTEFVANHSNAQILRVNERLPMFTNFNRGIRAAVGEYVVFFHDDDHYDPRFLEAHVAVLEANPQAAFAGSNWNMINGEGQLTVRRRLIKRTGTWNGRDFIERLVRRGRSELATPALVFRREVVKTRGFDERCPIHWGDFTILMRIAEQWDVAVVADPLFSWREHEQNSSKMPFSQSIPLRTHVLHDYCSEYAVRHPEDLEFLNRLRSFVDRGHNRGLLWGWLVASDDTESRACRRLLEEASCPMTVGLLSLLESVGLTVTCRRSLVPAARHVIDLIGI